MTYPHAYQDPTFWPARRIVTDISMANPAVVTTSFAHDYIDGIIVRLYVPRIYGMVQADGLVGEVTVISPTTFSVNIDTRAFDTFVNLAVPDTDEYRCAEVIAIGSKNSSYTTAEQNVLPY